MILLDVELEVMPAEEDVTLTFSSKEPCPVWEFDRLIVEVIKALPLGVCDLYYGYTEDGRRYVTIEDGTEWGGPDSYREAVRRFGRSYDLALQHTSTTTGRIIR